MPKNLGQPVSVTVYHPPNVPPAAADVTAFGFLREIYERGKDIALSSATTPSHMLTVPLGTDIRDGPMEIDQVGDAVYVPDYVTGAQYDVLSVVRRGNLRICYLRRKNRNAGPFTPN